MDADALTTLVTSIEPAAAARPNANCPAVTVPVEKAHALLARLRDDPAARFDALLDHTAVDWIAEDRVELLYNLFSSEHGHYLMVSVSVPRGNPVAPTVCDLWQIAQWQEREVYDLFGVKYDNHPDLRRIFLDDDWQGHPLLKDYQDENMLGFPK